MHCVGGTQPSPRGSHAAVCLDYNTKTPKLLVIGGYDGKTTLSDVWCLDVLAQTWQQVRSYNSDNDSIVMK